VGVNGESNRAWMGSKTDLSANQDEVPKKDVA